MSGEHFTPHAVAARLIGIPGARNLRDMGGYPTQDGRRVRRGILLRGGHPGSIPDEHRERLFDLGLAAIIDLRTTEERGDLPFPAALLERVQQYWSRDYALSRGDIVRMMRDPETSAEAMRQQVVANYRRLLQEQHDGIAAALSALVEGRVPMLVNCTAGKDRTGVTCAVMLSALGVPREIVRRDYTLTEELHDPSDPLFHVDPDGPFSYLLTVDPAVWRTMMRSAPEYIDATFTAIDEDFGGMEGYLHQGHGLGEAELRAMRGHVLEN
ncbi:MAG: tyrosine-protein phosphatase [Novosphingobium sp.]|nr:tyrosine-protein phosphatase [Novosphingobium sp.]